MNEFIPTEVARANRVGSSLSLLAIDITGFRAINAKRGVMEGDRILVEFARMLRTVFRGGDVVFRQGGDEFLIVMPESTEEQVISPSSA
jgi:two-component system, cell cycle response regulator